MSLLEQLDALEAEESDLGALQEQLKVLARSLARTPSLPPSNLLSLLLYVAELGLVANSCTGALVVMVCVCV